MRYGDITRGDRIVNVATGEIIGEVTAPPSEYGPKGSGEYSYTYTWYVTGEFGVRMWAGHYMRGPLVSDLDVDAPEVVPGEPTSMMIAANPPVYYYPHGKPIPHVESKRQTFAPRPFTHEHEIDMGGDRYESDFFGRNA